MLKNRTRLTESGQISILNKNWRNPLFQKLSQGSRLKMRLMKHFSCNDNYLKNVI